MLDYKFILGRGKYGIVRKAYFRKSGKIFAVKTIKKSNLKDKIILIKREAKLLKKTNHPSIVKLYEIY